MHANTLSIDAALRETGGDVVPEIRQELDAIDLAGWDKADPIIDLVQEAEAQAALLKLDADRLAAQVKAAQRRADNLKAYLLERMLSLGIEKLEGPRHACRLQDNPGPKITWPGKPDSIPEPFRRIKIELDPNAAKIAFYQGRLPEGFHVEQGRHLRIVV